MLDQRLKPWLLEINHTPSFKADTPLDYNIKSNLIKDTLKLLNINLNFKRKMIKKLKKDLLNRIYTGLKSKINVKTEQR